MKTQGPFIAVALAASASLFPFDAHAQETLVHGLDDVARTLRREAELAAFESGYAPRFDLARIP